MDPTRALAADDRALHPLLVGAFLAVIVVVFTATAFAWTSVFSDDTEPPSRAEASLETQAIGGEDAWIELVRVDSEAETIVSEDVEVTARSPGGQLVSTACQTPHLAGEDGLCRDPFEPGDIWSRADALWLPCRAEGGHRVTVLVRGTVVVDGAAGCDTAAPVST